MKITKDKVALMMANEKREEAKIEAAVMGLFESFSKLVASITVLLGSEETKKMLVSTLEAIETAKPIEDMLNESTTHETEVQAAEILKELEIVE